MRNKYAIFLFGTLFVLAADQLTKLAVLSHLNLRQSVIVVENLLAFTFIGNEGAVFGVFSGQKLYFFLILSGLAMGSLVYFFSTLKRDQVLPASALALILGGALGNQIDRVRLGFVVDFIDVHHKFSLIPIDFNWFKFNVADAAILIGVGLFLYSVVTMERQRLVQQEQEA
jgi:signal peptidase II